MHTPTPYRIKKTAMSSAILIVSGEKTIAQIMYSKGITDSEVLGNAAFFVEACNAHESLKAKIEKQRVDTDLANECVENYKSLQAQRDALLKQAKAILEHAQNASPYDDGSLGRDMLTELTEAIALCEKWE